MFTIFDKHIGGALLPNFWTSQEFISVRSHNVPLLARTHQMKQRSLVLPADRWRKWTKTFSGCRRLTWKRGGPGWSQKPTQLINSAGNVNDKPFKWGCLSSWKQGNGPWRSWQEKVCRDSLDKGSLARRFHMQMIQPSPGCVFKSLSTLESNDRIQNTQPPSYEIHRQRTPTHSFSLSLCSAENISCPHAASLNCSHWIPVSAIPSGQQIDIECVFRLRPSSC